MLTPIEIKGTTFKSGMGYAKKPVDDFVEELYQNYERLYKENVELKDKLNTLSEGIQYYKTIEKTLQKALVLAEKTATETKEAAVLQGETIEMEARAKAKLMLADAKNELNHLHTQTIDLARQYNTYKSQFKKIITTQLEMLEDESFQIDFKSMDAFSDMEEYAAFHNKELKEEFFQNETNNTTKEVDSNQNNYNFEQEKERTGIDSNKNRNRVEEENRNPNLKKSTRNERSSSSKKKAEKPKQDFQFSVYEESETDLNTSNTNDEYDLEPSKEVAASLEELLKNMNMGVSEEKGKKEEGKKNIASSNEKNKNRSKNLKRKEIDTMSDQEFLSKILSSSSDSDFMKNVMKSNTQSKKDDDDEAFEFIENE